MNEEMKKLVFWVGFTVFLAVLMILNYLLYTLIGIWPFIALQIISTLMWVFIEWRGAKKHEEYMTHWAEQFVKNNSKLIKRLRKNNIKHIKRLQN